MDIYTRGILSIFLFCGIVIITPLFLFCLLAWILEIRECDRLQEKKDLIPDFEQQFQAESKKRVLYKILVGISGIVLFIVVLAFFTIRAQKITAFQGNFHDVARKNFLPDDSTVFDSPVIIENFHNFFKTLGIFKFFLRFPPYNINMNKTNSLKRNPVSRTSRMSATGTK